MARRNTARTPQRPVYKETDEEASEQDGEGEIVHLGSDLPDAPGHESDASSEDAETGAEVGAMTAVLDHVLVPQDPTPIVNLPPKRMRISTGRLGRPSKDAYVNQKRGEPLFASSALQRRVLTGRPRSEFDLPADSPPKGLAARTKLANRKPDFSPLKRSRTAQLARLDQDAIDAQLLAESQPIEAGLRANTNAEEDDDDGDSTLLSMKSTQSRKERGPRGPKLVWTDQEDVVVNAGRSLDLTAEDIIERYSLTGRTPAAIRSRLKYLRDVAARVDTLGQPAEVVQPKKAPQPAEASQQPQVSVAQGWIQAETSTAAAKPSRPRNTNHVEQPADANSFQRMAKPDQAAPLRRSPRKAGMSRSDIVSYAAKSSSRDLFRDPEDDSPTDTPQDNRGVFEKPKLKLKKSSARLAKPKSTTGGAAQSGASHNGTTVPIALKPQDVTFGEQGQAPSAGVTQLSGPEDEDAEFHSASEGEAPDRGDDVETPRATQSTNASNTSRKRQAPTAPARKSKKRRPVQNVDEDDEAELQERTLDASTPRRLFGQWMQFKKAVYAARKIIRSKTHVEYDDFETFRKTCKALIVDLQALPGAAELSEAMPLRQRLVTLTAQVRALHTDDEVLGSERADWGIDIYACLIPYLIQVIEALVEEQERPPQGTAARSMGVDGTAEIINLMDLVQDAAGSARKNYSADPRSQYPIRQEVTTSIVVPLRDVRHALSKQHIARIAALNSACLFAQERADEAAFRATQQHIEAQESHAKRLRAKWNILHYLRRTAEDKVFERAKREHLANPSNVPEFDSAGHIMERVELFHARVGPTPSMVDAAKDIVWSMPQLVGLQEGLKKYAGERVLESVILALCKKGGVLHEFNVTEIVVQASQIREQLLEHCPRVEDWMRGIPDLGVWSRGSGGAENEDPGTATDAAEQLSASEGAEAGPSTTAGAQADDPIALSDGEEDDDDDDDDEEEEDA
ncbi:hypothetical protein B0A48_10442 [Cryoendolithus antarcticus]|uniref:Uncharacterized protein n=1 Tax=Cryoendolithus antarcticus TaxID=1507870 RepID=A0A1V8SY17_9PEZI|nr:hypothetical protein B0A48_10442 [Cryoendolithus antarcticus]